MIRQIHTTGCSFIEVMGRHSGYIALHTGIGSGASEIFLPEEDNSIEEYVEHLKTDQEEEINCLISS